MYQKRTSPGTCIAISRHTFLLLTILFVAVSIRVILASNYWPLHNSDEAIIGLMARHIQEGARPIFFYGQTYMGVLEAYISAFIFQIFGSTIFTLRIHLILLYTGFLISMYLLTRLLYTKKLALYVTLVLSLGSNAVLSRQLTAIGGYSEVILCSALAFLLVLWLALSYTEQPQHWGRRLCGYGAWGLVIGIGIWSTLLILPVAACSLLILLLFCWRELLRGALIPLFAGLIIGLIPFILYNLDPVPGHNSWQTLMHLQGKAPLTFERLVIQLTRVIDISIPTITGSPFCRTAELPFLYLLGFEPSSALTPLCAVLGKGWSLGFFALTALSCIMAVLPLWRIVRARQVIEKKSLMIRYIVHLLLIISALGTIIIYARSMSSYNAPAMNSRYLICVWITMPALLWPLWKGARSLASVSLSASWREWIIFSIGNLKGRILPIFSQSLLVILLACALFGTGKTLTEIPTARAHHAQEDRLIAGLLAQGITHVYTDYWTCYRMAFQSQERIICGVLSFRDCVLIEYQNRYKPYYQKVAANPLSSYIVTEQDKKCVPAIVQKLQQAGLQYRSFTIEGHSVYQPTD